MKKAAVESAPSVAKKDSKKKGPQLRVAKGVYRNAMSKTILSFIGWGLVTLFVVYACFAVTIMRVLPTTTSLGALPVKNMTYPKGMVPAGEVIAVDTAVSQGDSFLDKIRQSIIPSSSVALMKVAAGPYGKVSWAPSGLTTVDGKALGFTLKDNPKTDLLNDQYIGQCVGGACTLGEGLLVQKDYIYGQPLFTKGEKVED